MSVRKEIEEMRDLGPLPSEVDADPVTLKRYDELYRSIAKPVTNEEARILVELFGPDGCFGLASSIMHLVESAPGWPLEDCLRDSTIEWRIELRNRAFRAAL
ncbi:hypothetical protein [Pandoraea communis]|uniref:hypothetical protein n=1 Tax=Pandoraea communis TaxID=2508297 RepID=UPI0025A56FB3|nr:hypothetical protein [Pandoraea communis]MDM8359061.1 hypothetical protein [Pandoraea communis]